MTLDLRDAIKMIADSKPEGTVGLSLEFDCKIEAEDPKPLIKVLNYLINFLKQGAPDGDLVQISLNASGDGLLLNFAATTTLAEKPALNSQIPDVLKDYDASIQYDFTPSKFAMILVTFE
jgi:hypothetical protein